MEMNNETKTILLALGLGFLILLLTRPKQNKKETIEDKYSIPDTADESIVADRENAVIALTAMREAINNGEKPQALNELKDMILKENGIKVMISTKTKKLKALSKEGKLLAEE